MILRRREAVEIRDVGTECGWATLHTASVPVMQILPKGADSLNQAIRLAHLVQHRQQPDRLPLTRRKRE
jgi:hypothetical protein